MNGLLEATTSVLSAHCSTPILERYRCSGAIIPEFSIAEPLTGPNGFFRFGPNIICYGQSTGRTASTVDQALFDSSQHVKRSNSALSFPFDVTQIVNNLRYERYVDRSGWQAWVQESWVRDLYYWLRPMFPIAVRKHLQKLYLQDWDKIQFPGWPLDRTADVLIERLLIMTMRALETERLPFIWFWPRSHKACAIVTHDVETTAGRDFCDRLMDMDEAFGIRASFQVVPEERYEVPPSYLQMIRDRGFEINVQGLNHDGNLFRSRESFLQKAKKINGYVEQFNALGFRSPILYRKTDWFQDLNISYDMSVPNVARLEAQRGGCCTLMPYFLPGGITELPLTTTEDYTLFHVLNDYSTTLWKQQMNAILDANGLMTFLVHPDYVASEKAQDVYRQLLEDINRSRCDDRVWVTLPRELDRWWRERSAMTLAADGLNWRIEGAGSDRATVAYACLDGERLVYEF